MVFLGCVSQVLAMSGLVLIVGLQIYGYASAICTKLDTLLCLLASATDALKCSLFVTGTTVTLYTVLCWSSQHFACAVGNVY